MELTQSQKTALKTFINGDATLLDLMNHGHPEQVAAALNLPAVPDYFVWRRTMARNEVVEGASLDADGTTARAFDWAAAGGFIARSQGERDAFREIWNHDGNVNPSNDNVRTGWADIFSGSGAGAVVNRAHFNNVARRKATVGEKVCAVGTGTALSPAKLGFEGLLTSEDIERSLIDG